MFFFLFHNAEKIFLLCITASSSSSVQVDFYQPVLIIDAFKFCVENRQNK